MAKHTQTLKCLNVFDHFMGLALEGLKDKNLRFFFFFISFDSFQFTHFPCFVLSKKVLFRHYDKLFKKINFILTLQSEEYIEPCQTSKTELFAKTVHGIQLIFISTKNFISDVWQVSEYPSSEYMTSFSS